MKEWQKRLPPEMLEMLTMPVEELNDFSGPVQRLEVLSRIAFRRAVESVVEDDETSGATMWAEATDKVIEAREKKTQGRMALAINSQKALTDAKFTRLDAQEKFKKAKDILRPAMIQFSAKLPTPYESVARLVNMGKMKEARQTAKTYKIEEEFDWVEVD
jgi:hypothetical protein